MKIKIVCFILSLVFLAGMVNANGTYAWFIDYSEIGKDANSLHNLSAGDIGYTIIGSFKSLNDERIQPEQELLNSFTQQELEDYAIEPSGECKMYLRSTSLVDTNVRLKIFYTYIVPVQPGEDTGTDVVINGYRITHEYASVGENAPFVAEIDTNVWKYDLYDDCFYYEPQENAFIPAVSQGEVPETIPLFSSLRYSGEHSELPTSVFKNNNIFKVTVVFQAKQANYGATWENIGEIQFQTGEST